MWIDTFDIKLAVLGDIYKHNVGHSLGESAGILKIKRRI
jgi:hypothetical protein